MKDYVSNALRILLGIFLIGYALNQFLHVIPSGYGEMPEDARSFIDAVAIYLPFLYGFEILIGILLIINKWTPFILIVLFPLSISFLIFTYTNKDLSETWPALIVAVINVLLLYHYQEKYKPLFDK